VRWQCRTQGCKLRLRLHEGVFSSVKGGELLFEPRLVELVFNAPNLLVFNQEVTDGLQSDKGEHRRFACGGPYVCNRYLHSLRDTGARSPRHS